MTIDDFAVALRNPAIVTVESGWYESGAGRGYWANLYLNGWWYHFSVSKTHVPFAPDEVASAITSPERQVGRVGTYTTQKDSLEATVKVADHWYMINASGPPERVE